MIIKSKRNKLIDRRLIPGNWFICVFVQSVRVMGWLLLILCYTLWLGTLKTTGSYIPAWEPLWVCWYTCIYVLKGAMLLSLSS